MGNKAAVCDKEEGLATPSHVASTRLALTSNPISHEQAWQEKAPKSKRVYIRGKEKERVTRPGKQEKFE